jgi:hypothetical protein
MTPTTLTDILRDNNTTTVTSREATPDAGRRKYGTTDAGRRKYGTTDAGAIDEGKCTSPGLLGPQGPPTPAENNRESPNTVRARRKNQ